MSEKLLDKTTKSFLKYAIIILLIAAPFFYFTSEWLYVYETDEVFLFHKEAFIKETHKDFTEEDIRAWNKYNHSMKIAPDMGIKKDSIIGILAFDSIANEKEPFRILYAPIVINNKKYTYIEKANLVEMEEMVFSIAAMFLLIIIFMLIGIIWMSKTTAAKIWKPFYNTLSQIHAFEIDKNKSPQFETTNIDEFNRLNKSLEQLIEKNTSIYKNQREFIENAAHELQTPLAFFQTKIDSLLQMELNKEQLSIVSSLNNDVSKLNRLNKNLLLLSKMENDNYLEKTTLVLNDLINKNLDFFIEQAKAKNIRITTEYSSSLSVQGNPALAEVLINNLFLNAIRHNEKNGKIIIRIKDKQLSFANTGSTSPLAIDILFNRFSKTNPSSQGNGLVLAIIKKITEINQWQIDYAFEEHLHCFKLRF